MYHIKYSCVLTTTYIILLVLNKHNGDDSPQSYQSQIHRVCTAILMSVVKVHRLVAESCTLARRVHTPSCLPVFFKYFPTLVTRTEQYGFTGQVVTNADGRWSSGLRFRWGLVTLTVEKQHVMKCYTGPRHCGNT
jgi:hypothetical protein